MSALTIPVASPQRIVASSSTNVRKRAPVDIDDEDDEPNHRKRARRSMANGSFALPEAILSGLSSSVRLLL